MWDLGDFLDDEKEGRDCYDDGDDVDDEGEFINGDYSFDLNQLEMDHGDVNSVLTIINISFVILTLLCGWILLLNVKRSPAVKYLLLHQQWQQVKYKVDISI